MMKFPDSATIFLYFLFEDRKKIGLRVHDQVLENGSRKGLAYAEKKRTMKFYLKKFRTKYFETVILILLIN